MSEYKVTVIMPALNEEHGLSSGIEDVIASFRTFNIPGELIVVDDGSTDRTGRIADDHKAVYSNMSVIHHKSPNGIGTAFWAGVQKAQGDIVVMIPADGENEASEILRYVPVMDYVDIVVPFIINPEVRNRRRRLLSYLFRQIINITFRVSFTGVTGTVMYRRSILQDIDLRSSGFFYQPELLIKTKRRGYLYAEVPYALAGRKGGHSKSTTFRSLMHVARSYFLTVLDVYFQDEKGKAVFHESVTAERLKATR